MLCIFKYDFAFQNVFNWFPIRVHKRLPNHAKILRKSTIHSIYYPTQHNIHEMELSSKLHNCISLKSPSISTVWMHKYAMLWLLFLKQNNRFIRVIISATKLHCIIQTTSLWINPAEFLLHRLSHTHRKSYFHKVFLIY